MKLAFAIVVMNVMDCCVFVEMEASIDEICGTA
jgi:hypothetical protein